MLCYPAQSGSCPHHSLYQNSLPKVILTSRWQNAEVMVTCQSSDYSVTPDPPSGQSVFFGVLGLDIAVLPLGCSSLLLLPPCRCWRPSELDSGHLPCPALSLTSDPLQLRLSEERIHFISAGGVHICGGLSQSCIILSMAAGSPATGPVPLLIISVFSFLCQSCWRSIGFIALLKELAFCFVDFSIFLCFSFY